MARTSAGRRSLTRQARAEYDREMGFFGKLFGRRDAGDYQAELERDARRQMGSAPDDSPIELSSPPGEMELKMAEALEAYREDNADAPDRPEWMTDALKAFAMRPERVKELDESGQLPRDEAGDLADILLKIGTLPAISLYREVHGVGFDEAKEAVETIVRRASGED